MPARSAIIVVIDRLNTAALGPYGNTWLDTAAWNHLACDSLLIETALTDSVELLPVYRSYWQGIPSWQQGELSAETLPNVARQAGVRAVLITDDDELAQHPLAEQWDEIILLPAAIPFAQESADQTAFARILQEAYVWLAEANDEQPFLLWVHLRGMSGPWDAPYEMRTRLADDDDPDPPDAVEPPNMRLAENADPDIALGFLQAYGAQVLALDACLDGFVELLRALPAAQDALWAFTAPRGFPLGEHGRIGPCDLPLYSEHLQVPLMLRLPGEVGALARSQELTQPFDLFDAAKEWLQGADLSEPKSHLLRLAAGLDSPRPFAIAVAPGSRALRTSEWFLREFAGPEGELHELYGKPDDRYEANEVSDRCQDIANALGQAFDELLPLNPRKAEASPLLPSTRD